MNGSANFNLLFQLYLPVKQINISFNYMQPKACSLYVETFLPLKNVLKGVVDPLPEYQPLLSFTESLMMPLLQ